MKKGCKQYIVIFFNTFEKSEEAEEMEHKGYLKYYKVFAIEDVENLKPKRVDNTSNNPQEDAECLVNSYLSRESISLKVTGGDKAYYSPILDQIIILQMQAFNSSNAFYQTLLHECIHSSGHAKRLNQLCKELFSVMKTTARKYLPQ